MRPYHKFRSLKIIERYTYNKRRESNTHRYLSRVHKHALILSLFSHKQFITENAQKPNLLFSFTSCSHLFVYFDACVRDERAKMCIFEFGICNRTTVATHLLLGCCYCVCLIIIYIIMRKIKCMEIYVHVFHSSMRDTSSSAPKYSNFRNRARPGQAYGLTLFFSQINSIQNTQSPLNFPVC